MNETDALYTQSDIFIENREKIRITGVNDVDSFDDFTINVKTQKGELIIGGENLKINKLDLDSSQLIIEGLVHSLLYQDTVPKSKESFFGKLFK